MSRDSAGLVLGLDNWGVSVEEGSRFEDTFWFRQPDEEDSYVNIVTGGEVYLQESYQEEDMYRVVNSDRSSKSGLVKVYPEPNSKSGAEELLKEYMKKFPVGNPTNVRIRLKHYERRNFRDVESKTVDLNENLTEFLPEKFINWKMYRDGRPEDKLEAEDTDKLENIVISQANIRTVSLHSDYLDEDFKIQLGEVSMYSDMFVGSSEVMNDFYAGLGEEF